MNDLSLFNELFLFALIKRLNVGRARQLAPGGRSLWQITPDMNVSCPS